MKDQNLKLFPETKKEEFLSYLIGGGKHRYKRYDGLPLRYAGGKTRAVGHIIEHLPEGIKTIISPFFGGGSIEIVCAKELGLKVKGYDIFNILVNYWYFQINRPTELAKMIYQIPNTKEKYTEVREELKNHWTKKTIIENKQKLAAYYWYNHNLSYGPMFLGWISEIYREQKRYSRMVERVKNFKCPNLLVECEDFINSIPKHNNDFLYCDPPYYLGGDSKMFQGIYPTRNYAVHHDTFQHNILRDLLQNHKGGFLLSYNDCKEVRDMYSGFNIIDMSWQYTFGQGETRIGKNRIKNGSNSHIKDSHEILIMPK